MKTLPLAEARRLALAAQGFDRPRPARPRGKDLAALIERLALLQLDFVTSVVPSHYIIPFSRLGPYPRPLLDEVAYRSGRFTEAWAHEASLVPMDCWPLLRERRESHRPRPWAFGPMLKKLGAYMASVLDHVRDKGPASADDLPSPEGVARRIPGAWYGSVPRAALEAHFGSGRLVVTERRPNFSRAFDLPERVVPAEHREREVEGREAQRELLRRGARALGVGVAADLADYWRMPVGSVRPRIAELVKAGDLAAVRVEGWRETAFMPKGARAPRRIGAAALLSPFDPLIWFRPRTRRLFGFDYRMEVFVPAEKRRWGVYVLPFLLDDRLVARVDLKTDRAARRLRVQAAFLEPYATAAAVAPPLAAELRAMARWLELDGVSAPRRGNLARALGAVLRG